MIRVEYTNGKGVATSATTDEDYALALSNPAIDTFNTLQRCKYLSADGLGIDLSGTKSFLKVTDGEYNGYRGLVSKNLASSGARVAGFRADYYGDFSDVKTSSTDGTGITLEFDKNPVSHCRVSLYAENASVATVTAEYNGEATNKIYFAPSDFTPSTGSTSYCVRLGVSQVNLAGISVSGRAYLSNVAKGDVTAGEFKDIQSHNILDEINLISSDLPMCSFECVVANDTPPITDGKIAVYSNDKYINTYWIDSVEQIAKKTLVETVIDGITYQNYLGDDLYQITAYNVISLLDKSDYRGWRGALCLYGNSGLDNIAAFAGTRLEDFIEDARDKTGVNIVISNPENYGIYGYVDHKSFRHNLCAIAYALNMMVISLDGINISLVPIPSGSATIKKTYVESDPFADPPVEGNILGQAQLEKKQTVTKIEYYRYIEPTFDEIELSDNEDDTSGTVIRLKNSTALNRQDIEYPAGVIVNAFSVVVNGKYTSASLYDADSYIDHMNYYVTGRKPITNRIPINMNATVKTSDITKSSEEVVDKYDYFTVAGVTNRSDIKGNYSTFYSFGVYDDPFTGTAIDRTTWLKKYSASKGVVKARVILTDERVGDKVQITTFFGEVITGIITKMQIHCGYPNDVADIEIVEWA